MKKSTKILLLGGVTLCAAGLIIIIIVSALCGTVKITQWLKNGDFSIQIGNGFLGITNLFGDDEPDKEEMAQRYGDSMITGNVTKASLGTGEEIKNLAVEYGAVEFTVKQSEDEFFYISVDTAFETCCGVEEGTLYIEQYGKLKMGDVSTNAGKIVLYIPENTVFENVSMSFGAGEIDIQNIHAKHLEAGGRAGEINIANVTAIDAVFDMGAGEIEIQNGDVENLDIEVSMGEGKYKGSIKKSCNASCSTGKLSLKIEGKEEDFNYNVSCSAGEISIGSFMEGDGISLDRVINNAAEKEMNAECSLGEVDIEFFR